MITSQPLPPNRLEVKGQAVYMPAKITAFRPAQTSAMEEAIDHFESGKKIVIMEAPTGFGKTGFAEGVAQYFHGKHCYVCVTKSLQDQFLKDFPYGHVLKGRSNYPTELEFSSFRPTQPKFSISCDDCTYASIKSCSHCTDLRSCPYIIERDGALRASLAVLNLAYWLNCVNYADFFTGRDLVIIDEADQLEKALMGFVEVYVGGKWMDALNLIPPAKGTHWTTRTKWINDTVLPKMEDKIEHLSELVSIPKFAKDYKSLCRVRDSLQRVAQSLNDGGDGWVWEHGDNSFKIKPVSVKEWGQDYIWKHAKRFLVISATIIWPSQFAADLGLEPSDWAFVSRPSSFNKSRRPVYIKPVANMAFKAIANEKPKMLQYISNLLQKYPDDRVLIHTVSYDLNQYLMEELHHEFANRIITYKNSNDREATLSAYRLQPGAILLAPSFERGIDLQGDDCRLCIIPKVPFPSLHDPQISKRVYLPGGDLWYKIETIRSIVQMTGRGMRSPEDWVRTYILDLQFLKLWREAGQFFPAWWREAVRTDDLDPLSDILKKERL